ncbi:MAG TPA: hypothetical protein H9771_06785 [Candidatus Faecalibacterium faecipullorum]|uniref:Uncharacterized protein n=1 Tax=Candidatus Faecalibacterium faecipullorum TaxID=2838578 RepID=A0A9D2S7W7_9FIRM|nr:hypothetical protein [Candidatus Faecalibacterium faecipullorum]
MRQSATFDVPPCSIVSFVRYIKNFRASIVHKSQKFLYKLVQSHYCAQFP